MTKSQEYDGLIPEVARQLAKEAEQEEKALATREISRKDYVQLHRNAFHKVITPAEIEALLQTCIEKAKSGNRHFAKMLLPYCLGLPVQFIEIDHKQANVQIEIIQREQPMRRRGSPTIVDVDIEEVDSKGLVDVEVEDAEFEDVDDQS